MGDFVTRDAKHYPRQGRVTYRTIAEVVEKFNLTVVRCPVFHKLSGKARVIPAGEVCPDCPRCTRVRNTRKLVRIAPNLFRDAANIAEQTIKDRVAKLAAAAESAEKSNTYTRADLMGKNLFELRKICRKNRIKPSIKRIRCINKILEAGFNRKIRP